MSSSAEIKSQLESLWNTFVENDTRYREKGVKRAATVSRNALNEMKKLITPYKKASVQECKEAAKSAKNSS
jgi:hypothetical protein